MFGKRIIQITVILLVGLMMSGFFSTVISAEAVPEPASKFDKNGNIKYLQLEKQEKNFEITEGSSPTISKIEEDNQFKSHLATKEEIEAMKARIGVRDPNKNYNTIVDGHGTGLAPPTEEEWDAMVGSRIVDSVSTSRTLPTSVDHSQDPCFPKVGDQGQQGSCAAWATTYYINGYLQAKDNNWTDASTGNTYHLMSPAWTYNKVNEGTGSGTSFYDNYLVIKKVGCATWSTIPYSDSDYTSWGSEDAWRSAPKYRCDDWEWTDATNTEVIKTWLNDGYVLFVGIDADAYSSGLGDGDDTMTSAEYYEDWSDGGGHANTIVGYNDSKSQGGEIGAFKIVNSWGSTWGSNWSGNGYYWMTYDAVAELTSAIYRMDDKIDYEPSLLGVWNLNPTGARDAPVTLGVGDYGSPEETRSPVWDGGLYNFPSFMCLDITEFEDNWEAGTKNFYLEIGSGFSSSTITSFKIELYTGEYIPGSPSQISDESPDTPETTPCYVTVFLGLSNNPPTVILSSPSDAATIGATSVMLTWAGSDPDAGDTLTYDVYFDSTNGSTLVSNNQTGTSYTASNLSRGVTYYWKVIPNDGEVDGTCTSGVWSFTVSTETVVNHAPICINDNSEFTFGNGVTSGIGTSANPYIIENWDINASTGQGVHIENTDVYFIIRNCVIHNGKNNDNDGIYFYSVLNGKIDSVDSYNNDYGIMLDTSLEIQITNCVVYDNDGYGIWLDSSSNNQITNCTVHNNWIGIMLYSSSNNNIITNCDLYNNHGLYGSGIFLWAYDGTCDYNQIINCTVYNNDYGIRCSSSNNNTITNCTVYNNNDDGIHLYKSSANQITDCTFYHNYNDGIYLDYSSNNNQITYCNITYNTNYGVYPGYSSNYNIFYYNNFINNVHNAYDSYTNFWNNDYPFCGNYWGNYIGDDLYSGVNQDEPGSDGIGDTPYSISGGSNKDNYPLMNPVGINRPPVIQSYDPASDPTINETESMTFKITVYDFEDNIMIEWYLNGTLVTTGDSYTFVSDYDSAGTCTVNVTVSDGEYRFSHEWTLTVNNVNRAPFLTNPLPDRSFDEDTTLIAFNLNDYFSDPDGEKLIYTFSGNNHVSIIINADGAVDLQVSTDWYGGETIIFRATDPYTAFVEDTIIVTVNPVNDAPVIAGLTDQTIVEDVTFWYDITPYISDVDNNTSDLVVSTNSSYILVHNNNHTLKMTYPNGIVVDYVRVTLSDGLLSSYYDIVFTITPVNDAPVIILAIGDREGYEDTPFIIDVNNNQYDIDNSIGDLVWSVTEVNTSLLTVSINQEDDVITIISVANQSGSNTVVIHLSDGILEDTETITITIYPVNDPPVLSNPILDLFPSEGETIYTALNLNDYFSDIDSVLSFSYSENTNVMVTINDDGSVDISVSEGWHGQENITFTAFDEEYNISYTIRVIINNPPAISGAPDQFGVEDIAWTLDITPYISDVDNSTDELTISTNSSYATIDGFIITFNYPNGIVSENVRITVSDGINTSHQDIMVMVTPVNDAPVISALSDQSLVEDVTFWYNITPYISDIDNSTSDLIIYTNSSYIIVHNNNHTLEMTYPDGIAVDYVRITVSDGILSDYEDVIFTITPVNPLLTCSITFPLSGVVVSGTYTISGVASNPDGNVEKVEIKIDSGSWLQVSGTSSWSYSWDTTTVSDGQHTIYVRSYDGAEYSSMEQVTVTVSNHPATGEEPTGEEEGGRKLIIGDTTCFILVIAVAVIIVAAIVFAIGGRKERLPSVAPTPPSPQPPSHKPTFQPVEQPLTKITIHCPGCGHTGKVDPSFHGKLRCPACHTVFEV